MAKRKLKKAPKQSQSKPKTPETEECGSLITVNPPMLLKVCRLCETKDGPFLNIFDSEKTTAKKIDELLPIVIAENDDLPHKICFRCSAKVEELHEFVQKCIKTQENLCNAVGRKEGLSFVNKTKTSDRLRWEEKLNKSNISNEDICNAVIQKAMESINMMKLPPNETHIESEEKITVTNSIHEGVTKSTTEITAKKTVGPAKKFLSSTKVNTKKISENSESILNLDNKNIGSQKIQEKTEERPKEVNLKILKCDPKLAPTRVSRSNPAELLEGLEDRKNKQSNKQNPKQDSSNQMKDTAAAVNIDPTIIDITVDEEHSENNPKIESGITNRDTKTENEDKAFNIMDHVSIIKVNGVGVLYQCRMCNRNFLKKDVVATHGCAKNSKSVSKNVVAPEPPKPQTVKYLKINLDEDTRKKTGMERKMIIEKSSEICTTANQIDTDVKKPKPKIGPASKVKGNADNGEPVIGMKVSPRRESVPPAKSESAEPSVQLPSIPCLNSRYKLVPGPNNTYSLVEEHYKRNRELTNDKVSRKRKSPSEDATDTNVNKSKVNKLTVSQTDVNKCTTSKIATDVKKIAETEPSEPYPVGLFKTEPHHSRLHTPEVVPTPPIFSTSLLKKQSYTIVQTGKPGKMLISAKPQVPAEEVTTGKKRSRKLKTSPRQEPEVKQPFSVTLEDAAQPKDTGFFTFINVDPLLQPSYVLPTDNIIPEISTCNTLARSEQNEREKYTCNMCDQRFTREKKLLAHIQTHYNKMDEEDQLRSEKTTRKRGKKS